MRLTLALLAAAMAAACTLASRDLFHVFQLESYQFRGYFHSVLRSLGRFLLPGTLLLAAEAAVMLALTVLPIRDLPATLLVCAALIGAGAAIFLRSRKRKAKKPLAMTPRMKRLFGMAAAVYLLLMLVPGYLLYLALPTHDTRVGAAFLWTMLFPLLLPVWAAAAGLAAWPMERGINRLYQRDAERILASRPDLIKIGITGSYGKTSVKFILGTILEEKYRVLVTPSSFNTPMGLTRVIRTMLEPGHQVFVAEMGARHRRDIRDLTKFIRPRYGLLTSVGPQHLETFGSLENIKETKYDLIRAVPQDGCAFFADDGGIVRELYERTADKPRRLASLRGDAQADVWAENVEVSPEGSRFRLCTRNGEVDCATELLGQHNIQNILLAASCALELGLSLRQIARGIARLQPVEHRLQLIHRAGGLTMIDDAFNSNPNGAMAALAVLSQFPQRRIIVTPGMVELGGKEADFNRSFGKAMAGAADIAVLVGRKHTAPIREGLAEGGFPEQAVHTVASLDEAMAVLRGLARPGDTVMFENDLPDNYTE